MSRFWSPIVHSLTPYVAGEQPTTGGIIKLNTNESPYGPSPLALEAISKAASDTLRLYPDPTARELRATIAESFGIDKDEVFVGNGSDEVLAHTFQALLNHEKPLLFPDITYSFYPTYCRLYGITFRQVPVDAEMRVRLDDYRQPCGAIILPNPNAPTGIGLPLSDIEALVRKHPDQVVVIDEAYVDFGGESAVSLVKSYPNLLVIQTLSKSRGLAGLRVGFAVGQRPLIEALERVKDSFNSYPIDRLALAGAVAAWKDRDWFEHHRALIIASRERLAVGLKELGFHVLPSSTNFLFARHPNRPGADLAAELRSKGILIRRFSAERISDFLRISIGTDEECDRLLAALGEILR
ncbi:MULTISPECIES: histidinol-phosphate transaminase [unclassified Rhizobium]|uniref:histidinol-phosphate transaminase n=1 Tax=unclassified Rhizobium TaxID=2613769 RepID=UPI000EA96728|nr:MULTISPECIES: histidinol-phosphate transaminase [unclassified Rhizobium]AYG65483.1 histidinol-phosphate transaminase [Rhizobium sp. CCGE531]AYG71966.1 histidinol-phosphate transaminase [Rhizobium sp. CCGE532]